MRILIITENFRTGGLETQIMGFCRYLRSSGHEVHLISGIGSRTFPLREIIGDHILEVDMRPNISTKEAIKSINRIVSYAKEVEPEIFHLHPFTSIIYGGIAASLTNKPYVVTFHGPLSLTYGYNVLYRLYMDLILRDAWRVFCVSKEIAQRAKDIIAACNIVVFPNGVDTERFKPVRRDPSGAVALIARLDADKISGIKSFLIEWSRLPSETRRFVHVFGDGNSIGELKDWINNIDGESRIIFMGQEDHLNQRLKNGYSMVAGMGRVVLEAGAMNLPVILVGYNGPVGLLSLDNCDEFFCRNFSGRYASTIDIEKIKEQLRSLETSPERFLLRSWVLENTDEQKIMARYRNEIENAKVPEYTWKEAILSSIGEAEDVSLFGNKVFHCLLNNLPQSQANYHWANLYLAGKLNQTIAEKDTTQTQLSQIIVEKDALTSQLNQTISEKDTILNQLNQIIAEKENIYNQLNQTQGILNGIYTSDFWRLANWYYKVRDKSPVIKSIYIAAKCLKKNIKNISKFRAYARRYGLRQALKKSYEKLISGPKLPPSTYTIVIYPPTIDWNHTLFQRPHHIMSGLARKGFTVFFCTPNQIDCLTSDFVSIEKNLYLCKNIDRLAGLSGRKDLILYISNTMHKPLIKRLKPAKVIYDYIDELEVFSNYDSNMVVEHEELLKIADLVLVTSNRLLEKAKHIRGDAIICPNAVDYWHFATAQLPGPEPIDFKQQGLTSRPIIGYYGALAEWFDYDLLAKAARQRPNYNFVLIGLDYDGSLHKSGILEIPNVHYCGPKKYNELPLYLRYFDVTIIPFKLNKITHSTSPLKLFEYMSALKPVITTAMEELKKYSCVLIANNSEEFVHLLDKAIALKNDRLYLEELRNEALKNTWDSRTNTIIRWIQQPNFQRALIEYMNKSSKINHPMRNTYFEFASSTVERGNVVAELIMNQTKIEGKRYLDVGCAYGGFPIAFALRGTSEAIGVDINDNLIGLANTLLKDYDCPLQPKFFVGDILKCEEQDFGRFDIITCNDVIEHVDSPELLVKTLSILLNSKGIIYMEIPNAFNPKMVSHDGHYGLFGITLLDPTNSLLYHEHNFKSQRYDVGRYLDLNSYLKLFRSNGLEPILLNEIPEKEEDFHKIAQSIQSLPITYRTAIEAVPEILREHMQNVLKEYTNAFSYSYEKFLGTSGKERKVNVQQLYRYYGIEFWRFLLKVKEIS